MDTPRTHSSTTDKVLWCTCLVQFCKIIVTTVILCLYNIQDEDQAEEVIRVEACGLTVAEPLDSGVSPQGLSVIAEPHALEFHSSDSSMEVDLITRPYFHSSYYGKKIIESQILQYYYSYNYHNIVPVIIM